MLIDVSAFILLGVVMRQILLVIGEKILGTKLKQIPAWLAVVGIAHYIVFATAYAGFTFVNMFSVFGFFLPEVYRMINTLFLNEISQKET